MRSRTWIATPLACALAACGPLGSEEWVARIDDAEIRVGDLERLVDLRIEGDPDLLREDARHDELSRLVSEQIVLNRAREIGVEIGEDEVHTRLGRIHGSDWSDSDPDYLEEVRRQMLLDRTALLDLADRLAVPESALLLYFEEHRESFAQPERVEIRQLVVEEKAKAELLHERARGGSDFASLAAEHSLAPEAGEGGLLPPFARGELPEAFDRAFDLRPGHLSDVIESPYGFHVFQLERVLPPTQPEFEDVRAEVELELEQRRLEELKREWLRGLRRRADINVNERLLEELR